jgi:hypothetical protein
MQQAQFYFVRLCAVLALLAAAPALAGTMAQPHKPDPLLDGGPTAPCAAGVEYAAGSDVNGNPVPPADMGDTHVPLPDNIAVPLHGGPATRQGRHASGQAGNSPYIGLDGKRLDPLVNPKPCR